MSHPPDNSLDAQLRDVSAPPDLAERIKAALAPNDDELDAWLARVPVPETLTLLLHDIPKDVLVDEALADVPTPLSLAGTLRLTTTGQRLRRVGRQVARLALAASWFVAISVALAAGGGAFLWSVFPGPAIDDSGLIVQYNGPLTVEGELAQPSLAAAVATDDPLPDPVEQPFSADNPYSAANIHSALPTSLTIGEPAVGRPAFSAADEWTSLVRNGLHPLDDAMLLRFGVLGSPQYADDRLPELDAPLVPRPAGIEPPPVRGYDRGFFLKHRVFPPLPPAANPRLASLAVPLLTGSDVLARLERSLAEGRLPPASELRVEDFLAAMNYRFAPAPAGRLALRAAAGPSPFASPGTQLLQVGVQAGSLAQRPQPSTHLVLAIDLSQSMSRAGRLEMLQQGIDRLLDQLGPLDRLSLVVFDEQVVHRVELAASSDAPVIRQLLAELTPHGGTNLAAGLQQAASLAMSNALSGETAKRLVLITDSHADLPAPTHDRLRQMLIAARDAGVRLDVLDLSGRDAADPVLSDWAGNLGGELRAVQSARAMFRSLLAPLTGGSPLVATDARLTLHFNPQAVAAFRLIGHEANALTEVTPAAVAADLAAGDAATALVELWLVPGEVDDLGRAELTWQDAAGRPQQTTQRLSRLQIAPTFAQSAVSLQQAALAAEVGQELRGSRTALRELGLKPAAVRGLPGVATLARSTNSQLRQQPDFQRLLDVVGQLENRRDR